MGELQLPDHSGICEREARHLHQPLTASLRASLSSLCISFRLSVTFTLSQRGSNHTASCSSAGRAPIRMPCAHKTRRKWSAAFHAYSTSNEIKPAVMLLVAQAPLVSCHLVPEVVQCGKEEHIQDYLTRKRSIAMIPRTFRRLLRIAPSGRVLICSF